MRSLIYHPALFRSFTLNERKNRDFMTARLGNGSHFKIGKEYFIFSRPTVQLLLWVKKKNWERNPSPLVKSLKGICLREPTSRSPTFAFRDVVPSLFHFVFHIEFHPAWNKSRSLHFGIGACRERKILRATNKMSYSISPPSNTVIFLPLPHSR